MSYKPKLIALDLDGTLFDSRGSVSTRTKTSLQKAMAEGTKVIIATGRMYPSAMPIIKEIGITDPCVFYNGAIVRNPVNNETIYERGLCEDLTAEVLAFYHSMDWYIQVYSDDRLYVQDGSDPKAKFYESIAKIEPLSLGEHFWQYRTDATKLLGISQDKETFYEMARCTKEHFSNRLYCATSWGAFVEMVHPQVNKARGLEIAARHAGVERCDVLAIGDSGNDKEMLEWAGWGVAMGNASYEVKTAADEVAPTNNEDGVAFIVERYLKI